MLHRRRHVRIERKIATSLEQIRADATARFEHARFEVAPEHQRLKVRKLTMCDFRNMRIDLTRCVGGRLRASARGRIDIGVTLRGAVRVRHAGCEIESFDGSIAAWATPGNLIDVEVRPGSFLASLLITPEHLLQAGQQVLGDEFRLPEEPIAPVPDVLNTALARNILHVYRELTELDKINLSDLVSSAYEEQLTNLVACAMRPDLFRSEADQRHGPCSIARRAEEILQSRAMEPVTISAVAEELGVTVRTLQMSFRKHRGQSPLQFLLNQRMAVARARLLNPELRDNVQCVAMTCGFLSMSKFSSRYRATYGELPSETLARGRSR